MLTDPHVKVYIRRGLILLNVNIRELSILRRQLYSTTVTNGNQAVHRRPLILQRNFGRRSVVARTATRAAPLIALYALLPRRPSTRRRRKLPIMKIEYIKIMQVKKMLIST